MRSLRRDGVLIGAAFTAEALFLHWLYWRNAGPLWRDEVGSAVVSLTPWPHLLDRMQFDSFPAFWLLLLRGWMFLFGDGVTSLRTMGVLTGLLLVAAIWFALRTFGVQAPMLAFALAAATATVVRFGDSLRAYGFGAVIGLVSMALLYRTCVAPTRTNFILAALVSLLAVQTTFHNAPLLLACCIAAAVVHRDLRRAAMILGIGAISAASLLIYLPMMRKVKAWSDLVRYDVDVGWILSRFREAATINGGFGVSVWIFALVAALALAATALWLTRARGGALLFCTITLVVYTVAQTAFLAALGFLMQPWYFLLWMVVAAVLIDAIVVLTVERQQLVIRGAAAFFIILIAFDETKTFIAQRTTNVDLIVATLQHNAAPGDYIIVYPWHLGASFNRYYHGSIPWQTYPPLPDHSVQRYDEAHAAMTDTRERAVIDRAVGTLRNGGHVWYVGRPLYIERIVYVHENQTNPRVESDVRWSGELENAIRAVHASATMVRSYDAHTAFYENVALVRIDGPSVSEGQTTRIAFK
jgi:hypothetical protein